MPIPSNKLNPVNNSPDIKSRSTTTFPERELKMKANGPSGANFKNPVVGETPAIHALSEDVAKPSPSNLSKNAHNMIKDMDSLKNSQSWLSVNDFIDLIFKTTQWLAIVVTTLSSDQSQQFEQR